MSTQASVFTPQAGAQDSVPRLGPPWGLLTTAAALIWGYIAIMATGATFWVSTANMVGPVALGAAAGGSVARLVRRHHEAIWTPYAWFLLAVILFYGLGPLIYPLGGPRTVAFAEAFLPVHSAGLLMTNLLNAVGVLSVLFGIAGGEHLLTRKEWAGASCVLEPRLSRSITAALTFLVLGGVIEYLLVLPSNFGAYGFVLPGVVQNLGNVYLLGLMLLAYIVARGKRAWILPFAVLWAVQVAVSVLLFSKQQLILSLILPPVGAFLVHGRLRRLVAWGLVAAAVYVASAQFVLWGRQQVTSQTGFANRASLTTRAHIVERWVGEGMPVLDRRVSAAGTGWNRLNYAPEQALAMSMHDEGLHGDTLRYAPIIFIPRIIWPSKPVVTNMSLSFYETITGRHGTHLGLGIFGEGYWDYGWLGVVGLGLGTGLIFALLGALSILWMRRRAFEYLPGIFIGVNMGIIGTSGFFVNYVLGPASFFFIYSLAAYLLVKVVTGGQARRASQCGRSASR